jgi:hypothetical protein
VPDPLPLATLSKAQVKELQEQRWGAGFRVYS